MKLEQILIRLAAAFFILYGLLFTLFPGFFSGLVTGSVPSSASGLIDMRATYGGLSIAVGALMMILASKAETLRLGLLSVVLVLLGMATARSIGIVLDGDANLLMYVYLAAEILPALVAILLLKGLAQTD